MPSIDKDTIRKNFSRCARFYDDYADIQRLAAGRLIDLAPAVQFKYILEIGCGTGSYTVLLRERFGSARIKAVEISEEMVRVARLKPRTAGVDFVIADAERIGPAGPFDLVTSNASFQWFENMELSLKRYKEVLSGGGAILFSAFGPLTFSELGRVLEETAGKEAAIDSKAFPDRERLTELLKKYFRESAVEEFVAKERYSSLKDLLHRIKYTGARGSGLGNRLLWKKEMFELAEERYREIFGTIEATYQIFFCRAFK